MLDGCVDHRDTLLTDPERADGMMLVCISRAAKGHQLTLDLSAPGAPQPVFGSGMPSLVANSASSWVDRPNDTSDRANKTSVR